MLGRKNKWVCAFLKNIYTKVEAKPIEFSAPHVRLIFNLLLSHYSCLILSYITKSSLKNFHLVQSLISQSFPNFKKQSTSPDIFNSLNCYAICKSRFPIHRLKIVVVVVVILVSVVVVVVAVVFFSFLPFFFFFFLLNVKI